MTVTRGDVIFITSLIIHHRSRDYTVVERGKLKLLKSWVHCIVKTKDGSLKISVGGTPPSPSVIPKKKKLREKKGRKATHITLRQYWVKPGEVSETVPSTPNFSSGVSPPRPSLQTSDAAKPQLPHPVHKIWEIDTTVLYIIEVV